MRWIALALLLAAGIQGAASAAPSPRVRTLAKASGPIVAFAQDGPRFAWLEAGRRGRCNQIHVRDGSRKIRPLPSTSSRNRTCRWRRLWRTKLALAGDRVLWTLQSSGAAEVDRVLTTSPQDRRERELEALAHTKAGVGEWLGGLTGDRTMLAYTKVTIAGPDCQTAPCPVRISGGETVRIVKGKRRSVPNTKGGIEIAAGSGHFVLLPPTKTSQNGGRPFAGPGTAISVRENVSGKMIGVLSPPGLVSELALSGTTAVALTADGGRRAIELYNLKTLRFVGDSVVPFPARDVSISTSGMIVYRVNSQIWSIDPSGRRRLLVKAPTTPIGLSIEGNRVAWAENESGVGRIRTLDLR